MVVGFRAVPGWKFTGIGWKLHGTVHVLPR
jgi:hypothetical protein